MISDCHIFNFMSLRVAENGQKYRKCNKKNVKKNFFLNLFLSLFLVLEIDFFALITLYLANFSFYKCAIWMFGRQRENEKYWHSNITNRWIWCIKNPSTNWIIRSILCYYPIMKSLRITKMDVLPIFVCICKINNFLYKFWWSGRWIDNMSFLYLQFCLTCCCS